MSAKLHTQLKNSFPILIGLYIPMLILVAMIVLVGHQFDIPMDDLTRDPAAIRGDSPFIGVLSYIGVLFWCASVAICLFSFALLKQTGGIGEFTAFFLFGGLISLLLLLDDLFLFHETVFPLYLKIPEKLVFLSYGLMILGYITRFRKLILKTDFIFLLLAFGLLGLSIFIDLLDLRISILLEDGSKLFGIISWFGYLALTCFQVVKQNTLQLAEKKTQYFS
ncbi:hypothetical protein [Allocoleopsis franciscana]|uniref:DUF998 domain-containing protein n=1 Tax=Allocoleopsis franciscana PCC 7113 TaxID=1173027 RepID=K9WEC0_9CYAN|nr:hypothetical protein [Allocoleopsis franciscana]AFZ18094.1 hypothetical protein Mic7113_2283 [Allocoleopsis franciscana PCC 7113]